MMMMMMLFLPFFLLLYIQYLYNSAITTNRYSVVFIEENEVEMYRSIDIATSSLLFS